MTDTNTLKETAMDFLRLTARGEVDEAFARYAAPGFRHHNPHFAADAATLQAAMKENAARFPHMVFEVQRALCDGPLVAVHSRAVPEEGGSEMAIVHILRFEEGRIAEMWDIAQAAPVPMANRDGMF
ncbi:Predicted SnoaL-like aldol condensation-catalyzing enzyme [Massilia sp. PDC64]|nr:nuclear transport factor 2 family protein [Massilia sp. PDC64]SDF48855.1 Predicted SnoaL-like aldol condensation-catalyzing enzyme [Massilia sp. PDC64]